MSGLAAYRAGGVFRRMSETPTPKRLSEAEAFGQALKRLRKRAAGGEGITQDHAAELAGVQTGSWRRYEWGERDLSLGRWTELAEAIGFTQRDLMLERARLLGEEPPAREAEVVSFSRRPQAEPGLLPIRGRVQAGAWLEVDDFSQVEPQRYPAARDPRFPTADQWLELVVGDSMNLAGILDGDLVHCVDATDIGYSPKTGDIVKVERLRADGALREVSIKEVEIVPDGARLWPRSTNARFREPLELTEGARDGEDMEVRVAALVLASIRRFAA